MAPHWLRRSSPPIFEGELESAGKDVSERISNLRERGEDERAPEREWSEAQTTEYLEIYE